MLPALKMMDYRQEKRFSSDALRWKDVCCL